MRCYVKHFAYISVIKVQNFCVVFCPLFGCLFVSAHYICIRGVVWIEKTRSLLSWTYLSMARQPRLSHLASPAWNSRFGVCDQEAIQPRDHAKGGRHPDQTSHRGLRVVLLLQHNMALAQFLSSVLQISHEFYELSYKYAPFCLTLQQTP